MIRLLFATIMTVAILITGSANSQSLDPNRPIRFVVPFAPGGQSDILTRIVAEGVNNIRPTTVENRSGGYIAIGGGYVLGQPSDGHTILNVANGINVTKQYVPELPFDPREEFSIVAILNMVPMAIVIPTINNEIQDASSLIAAVRARPDFYTYATAGGGGTPAMVGTVFTRGIGSSMVNVPYRGLGPSVPDLLAGRLTVMFDSVPVASQIHNRGARMIAVTSEQRLQNYPDIPTFRELGINDTFYSWQGLFVRSNTPRHIREQLNVTINQALRNPEVRRRIIATGTEESWIVSKDLTQIEIFMNSEIAKWREIFGK
jgi:tripartite-type tricarboxylate transporter receptor subunit TctC